MIKWIKQMMAKRKIPYGNLCHYQGSFDDGFGHGIKEERWCPYYNLVAADDDPVDVFAISLVGYCQYLKKHDEGCPEGVKFCGINS